jgi:hypothetical protein
MSLEAPDAPAGDPPPPRRWPGWLGWPVLAGAGLVAYELTAQPALVGLTLSLKFGVQDARTAVWLRRRDPDRRRGAAHFWLYLAHAAWKMGAAGAALGFVCVFALAAVAGPGPPKGLGLELFGGSALAGFGGFLASAVLAVVAVAKGWWHRRPLWLNSGVAAARVRGEWPPWYGQRNDAGRLILLGGLLVLTVGGLTGVIAGAALLDATGVRVPGPAVGVGAIGLAMFGLPVGGLLLRDYLLPRVTAAAPWDAWPPEPDPHGPPADRVD